VNGARLDIGDLGFVAPVGDGHGGQVLAFFGEHLDAGVISLEMKGIAGGFLNVKVDGGCAGGLGVGGHFEFVGGGLLELGGQEGGRSQQQEREDRAQ